MHGHYYPRWQAFFDMADYLPAPAVYAGGRY